VGSSRLFCQFDPLKIAFFLSVPLGFRSMDAASARGLSRKRAAEQLNVSPPTLLNWSRETWFPENGRNSDGTWNVAAIRTARDALGRRGSERSDQGKALKLANEAERLKQNRVKTQQLQLQLGEDQRNLFPRAGIELFVASFLTAVGDDLDQLPSIIAKDLPAKYRRKFSDRLRQELDDLRRRWRADLEREARERDVPMPDATTEPGPADE
jgi:hypothetical protein